jgi:hypothetical protein
MHFLSKELIRERGPVEIWIKKFHLNKKARTLMFIIGSTRVSEEFLRKTMKNRLPNLLQNY